MLFERLIPTEDCSLCELQDICNAGYVTAPSYSLITCEAFKNAVREYGGKEKLLEEVYNLVKEAVLYKEEKQGQFSLEYCSDFLNTMTNNTEKLRSDYICPLPTKLVKSSVI